MENNRANTFSRRAALRLLGTSATGLAASMCLRAPTVSWLNRRIRNSAVLELGTRYWSDEHYALYSRRVGAFASKICELLQVSSGASHTIVKAALLHDIGMIAVPESILRKPSRLTSEEMSIMRRHCRFGFELLSRTGIYEDEAEIVLAHHENFDGSGYPQGLAGEEIPLGARIIRIADAIVAMTDNIHEWDKKRAFAHAIREISYYSNAIFDPQIVRKLRSSETLESIC